MWDDLIAKKAEWIGGRLVDTDQDVQATNETTIVDIRWGDPEQWGGEPNDFIEIVGADFTVGGRRKILGLSPHCPPGGLRFVNPYGMEFTIFKGKC